MRGCPVAMASLNWSRMFCGSATPEFSRMILHMSRINQSINDRPSCQQATMQGCFWHPNHRTNELLP